MTIRVEASHIPRFLSGQGDSQLIENLCAQRTLWSSIQELMTTSPPEGQISSSENRLSKQRKAAAELSSSGHCPVVELCFVAEPEDRRNRVLINIHNLPSTDLNAATVIETLPEGYGWQTLGDTTRLFNSAQELLPEKWYISRIERRLNFIDLPWRMLEEDDVDKEADTSWDSRWEQQSQLITEPVLPADLESERYCIPVTGALEIDPRSSRVFFRELQAQAPCVVSVAIAPVDIRRVDGYRQIAMLWAEHLRTFGHAIANAGLTDHSTLQAQYDRFLLPHRFLCVVTVRAAAATAVSARSLALHACARLGGLRSFRIRRPQIAPIEVLGDPWLDVPHQEYWSAEAFEARRNRLRRELDGDNVCLERPAQRFEDFLIELPHLYTVDEAASMAGLPISDDSGLPGLDTRLVPPFSEPSNIGSDRGAERPPPERVRIGMSLGRDTNRLTGEKKGIPVGEWHTIPSRDLTKHAFIVGSTGSGKTVTTLFILRELARIGIPFLVIEPVKTEYFDHLSKVAGLDLQRVRLEGDTTGKKVADFLSFDPLRLQPGVSVARHASYLKSCFEAAFPLEPILAMMLDAGIRGYYTDQTEWGCGLEMFTRGSKATHRGEPWRRRDGSTFQLVHPSFEGFANYFLNPFLKTMVEVQADQPKLAELREQWTQIFRRRFDAIATSMVGMAAHKADDEFREDPNRYDTFSALIERPTVLELDGIPDDEHKALMMAFIMSFLFERRQAEDLSIREAGRTPNDALRHVVVIEEAHRVLANITHNNRGDAAGVGAQAKSVSLFVEMLAEMRAFGQGLLIVEQIPTKIVPEAVKNTNLKIMLRLTAADDREFLGAAMNFTEEQKRFVTSLRAEPGRGIDMVVFEQQLDQPRLLRLPLEASDKRPIHGLLFGD